MRKTKFDYSGCDCPGHLHTKLQMKQRRCEIANQAIKIIASYGRRFFFCAQKGTYATLEVDARGRVWFVDDYSQKRVYTHDTTFGNKWRGFSHGGTLKDLVKLFRDFILTGKQIHHDYLGLERLWADENIWGYEPSELSKVRDNAGQLECFSQPSKLDAA